MLSNVGNNESESNIFSSVAEGAWERQADHERFLFKKARPHDHPSRASWMNANRLWVHQVQARRAGRFEVI